jgi:predicted transcriptional regulator of viral defense system
MKTKINMLYDMYAENPKLTNAEAAQLLSVDPNMVRTMKSRLIHAAYIELLGDGSEVAILRPYKGQDTMPLGASYKSQVYSEMVEAYLEDFRSQTTFNDRLAVGREIRLLLEKM